ncbi:putative Spermidine/putrescine ABC transporter substrate-binding protein [Candidatus Magnetomoraceae bacterium gMMP-1]
MKNSQFNKKFFIRFMLVVISLICTSVLLNTATRILNSCHVNVLNWDFYISQSAINSYQKSYDVKVNYDTYSNNEEALDLVLERKGAYDIVFPSDYMMSKMRKLGLLGIIDYTELPNIRNVSPAAMDLFRNKGWLDHCVPYLMGTTGFAAHHKRAKIDVNSITWRRLSSIIQANHKDIPSMALIDDGRQVISSILLELGHDPNSPNERTIDDALQILVTIAPAVSCISSKQIQKILKYEEVDIVFGWSGDILQVIREKTGWEYSLPVSGGIGFIDGICLLRDAPNRTLAKKMINHLLDSKVHATIVNETRYITSNDSNIKMLNEPGKEVIFLNELSTEENRLVSLAWDKMKSAIRGRHFSQIN